MIKREACNWRATRARELKAQIVFSSSSSIASFLLFLKANRRSPSLASPRLRREEGNYDDDAVSCFVLFLFFLLRIHSARFVLFFRSFVPSQPPLARGVSPAKKDESNHRSVTDDDDFHSSLLPASQRSIDQVRVNNAALPVQRSLLSKNQEVSFSSRLFFGSICTRLVLLDGRGLLVYSILINQHSRIHFRRWSMAVAV